MGKQVMHFKRNKEVRRGHLFREADDTGGFRHVGSKIFSNRKVRHKVYPLEESPAGNKNLEKPSFYLFFS